jgi:[ribosomal protein S5]-alanine N-acetyltransferase
MENGKETVPRGTKVAKTNGVIETARLALIPATPLTTRAALMGREALAQALALHVTESWPPDLLDQSALEYMRDKLELGAEHTGWWLHFVVLRDGPGGGVVIGTAGYKGPPDPDDGTVEIGYSVVRDFQRQGYATETARALVVCAFEVPGIRRVIAETLPGLTPSIGVLRKCGFRFIGDGSEPGVIRYELTRRDRAPSRITALS